MILITHLLASGLRLQQRLSQQTAEGIAESAYCQVTETKKKEKSYSLQRFDGLTAPCDCGIQLTNSLDDQRESVNKSWD